MCHTLSLIEFSCSCSVICRQIEGQNRVTESDSCTHFCGRQGAHQILLIGHNKKRHVGEALFFHKLTELNASLLHTASIGTVNDIDLPQVSNEENIMHTQKSSTSASV